MFCRTFGIAAPGFGWAAGWSLLLHTLPPKICDMSDEQDNKSKTRGREPWTFNAGFFVMGCCIGLLALWESISLTSGISENHPGYAVLASTAALIKVFGAIAAWTLMALSWRMPATWMWQGRVDDLLYILTQIRDATTNRPPRP